MRLMRILFHNPTFDSYLELMLRHENKNLRYGISGELPVVKHLEHEVQLYLLGALYVLYQGHHRLVIRCPPEVEIIPARRSDPWWRPRVLELQVKLYRRYGRPGAPHCKQVQLSGVRYAYVGYESDVVVGEGFGFVETFHVVEGAILNCLFAPISVIFIPDIIRRADNMITFETSSSVQAYLFVPITHALFLAFIDILACPLIRRQPVSGRTGT